MINKKNVLLLFSAIMLMFYSCQNKKKQANIPDRIEVPEININLDFNRFEKAVFEHGSPFDSSSVKRLRNEYGNFFDLWCTKLAGITPPSRERLSDSYIANNLNDYLSDKYIQLVYSDCKNKFKSVDSYKASFSDIFKRYKVLFPGKNIPKIVTYVSPFTSNVMAMDSVLGIGLHFYLGANYKYYPSLQLPQYMTKKFREEYILTDAMKGWMDSEYTNDSIHRGFLNQMMYQGKILFSLDMLTPDIEDSIKIGYTEKQFNWAVENETEIWSFFIEQQLLYNTNPKNYLKYINDGNGTNGFPPNAPAQLGAFIGWQIVRSFMHKHPEIKLTQLFAIQNAQLLLSQSGYKPSKNNK